MNKLISSFCNNMSLGEYLSVPFLITLGITLLLVGIVGLFFTQRLQEQNHKMNSMVGLVSTMAEEVNYLRRRLVQIGGVPANSFDSASGMKNYSLFASDPNNLIEVSDGEQDDDDDDEDDDSDDDSDESDYESDVDADADADADADVDNSANIKVINIHESSPPETFVEELDDSESDDESDDSKSESSESINLVEIESSNDLEAMNISLGNSDDKQINLDLSITDYKKLSLNKLRSRALEKGLSDDANKLKKPELLKLLGSA